jgi:hypothetical protein
MEHKGKIFKTNSCGEVVILNYINYQNVQIKFLDTGYETVKSFGNIQAGTVMDRLRPTVYNVGVIGEGNISNGNILLKEYRLWNSMLQRCYDNKLHEECPTYTECVVSDNFKYFPYFKEWCLNQVGFGLKDDKGKPFALDKDILVKGNKVYSEDNCAFVPREINNVFLKGKKSRGDNFIGVNYHTRDKVFASNISKFGHQHHLGYFNTEMEAFYAYKQAKEDYIKEVAEKWKDQIDPRVYEALMKYEVDINDRHTSR